MLGRNDDVWGARRNDDYYVISSAVERSPNAKDNEKMAIFDIKRVVMGLKLCKLNKNPFFIKKIKFLLFLFDSFFSLL